MAQVLVVYLRQKVKSKDAMSRPSFSIPTINDASLFNKTSSSSVPSSPAKQGIGMEDHRSGATGDYCLFIGCHLLEEIL